MGFEIGSKKFNPFVIIVGNKKEKKRKESMPFMTVAINNYISCFIYWHRHGTGHACLHLHTQDHSQTKF